MKDSECATSSAHMCFPTVNIEKNEIKKLNFLQLVDTWQYFRHPGTTANSGRERLGLKQKTIVHGAYLPCFQGLAWDGKIIFALQQLIRNKKL